MSAQSRFSNERAVIENADSSNHAGGLQVDHMNRAKAIPSCRTTSAPRPVAMNHWYQKFRACGSLGVFQGPGSQPADIVTMRSMRAGTIDARKYAIRAPQS